MSKKLGFFRRVYNAIAKFVKGTEEKDLSYKQLFGIFAVRVGRLVVYPIYNGIVRPVMFLYRKVRGLFDKKVVVAEAAKATA